MKEEYSHTRKKYGAFLIMTAIGIFLLLSFERLFKRENVLYFENIQVKYGIPILLFCICVFMIVIMTIVFYLGMQQEIYEWRIFLLIGYYLLIIWSISKNPIINDVWEDSVLKSISLIPLFLFLGCWLYTGWRKYVVFGFAGFFSLGYVVCFILDHSLNMELLERRNYWVEFVIFGILGILLMMEYHIKPERIRKKIPRYFWALILFVIFFVSSVNAEHIVHHREYWIRVVTEFIHGDARQFVYLITESAAIMVSILNIRRLIIKIQEVRDQMNNFRLHIRMEAEREKQIKRFYGQYREVKHELKHHLLVIGSLLDHAEYDKARDYVHEVEYYTRKLPQIQYSQNVIVNQIAAYYAVEMQQQDIPYTYELNLPEKLPVSDVDLSMLLTNILDNAIEASLKFKEGERPFIYAHMMVKGNIIFLEVSNKMTEKPHVDSEGNLITSKSEKNLHGYGVGIIKRIVHKYDGSLDMSYSEHSFYVRLYLNGMDF